MTDRLESLAREAGMHRDGDWWFSDDGRIGDGDCDVSHAVLTRFAALVRADALEDAAKEADRYAEAVRHNDGAYVALVRCAASIRRMLSAH